MATQINQIDDNVRGITTLRVEGDMLGDDARLLERIGVEIHAETGNDIIVDVADLDFLDSDAAPILRRLDMLDGFSIQGMEIFLQTVINEVERHTV
ncbi:MAG TPA: hypothetical protein PLP21_05725 [Pyrinomonadaceae bacterium]|nr:hypothetical protein [Acidobacteriota bacterium]HQZ95796.1 hypothetical protein [Pyrinomonadaceae bacterium]